MPRQVNGKYASRSRFVAHTDNPVVGLDTAPADRQAKTHTGFVRAHDEVTSPLDAQCAKHAGDKAAVMFSAFSFVCSFLHSHIVFFSVGRSPLEAVFRVSDNSQIERTKGHDDGGLDIVGPLWRHPGYADL